MSVGELLYYCVTLHARCRAFCIFPSPPLRQPSNAPPVQCIGATLQFDRRAAADVTASLIIEFITIYGTSTFNRDPNYYTIARAATLSTNLFAHVHAIRYVGAIIL